MIDLLNEEPETIKRVCLLAIILIPLCIWYNSCNPPEKEKPTRFHKTVHILDKAWTKWVDKNYKP